MTRLITVLVLVIAGTVWSAAAGAASFNCNQSLSAVETMVCSDLTLSAADDSLAQAFQDLRNVAPENVADQWQWVEQRNQCADIECISASYLDRIQVLEQRLATHRDANGAHSSLSGAEQPAHEAAPSNQENLPQYQQAVEPTPTDESAPPASAGNTTIPSPREPRSIEQKVWDESVQLAALGLVLFMLLIVVLGGTRTIVVCYNLKDFAWSFTWVLALVGVIFGSSMMYPEGQSEPTLTGMIVVGLSSLVALVSVAMVFANAIRYNRSVLVGLVVGIFKMIFGLAFVVLVWGALLGNGRGGSRSGGNFAALAIFALIFYGLCRATINGPEVYQKRGWPEPA